MGKKTYVVSDGLDDASLGRTISRPDDLTALGRSSVLSVDEVEPARPFVARFVAERVGPGCDVAHVSGLAEVGAEDGADFFDGFGEEVLLREKGD